MRISFLLQILGTGVIILIGAILINGIAKTIGLLTWYDFIGLWSEKGFQAALAEAGWISGIFLFLVYPFLLGMLGYLGVWLIE